MAKDLKMVLLLDFYGEMLTEKQREIIESYYYDDLSLGEIGDERGISRQGARDAIKRSEAELIEMEERLGLVKRFKEMEAALTRICDCAIEIKEKNAGSNDDIDALAQDILETAAKLAEEENK